MLRQASVSDLVQGRVTREDGHIVLAMRFYPRFIRREQRDEYLSSLAPHPELIQQLKEMERAAIAHDEAFEKVGFERRFELTAEGLKDLERLVQLSREKNVYLVCQCKPGERCHRELLLMLAQARFGAETERTAHVYPEYARRLRG